MIKLLVLSIGSLVGHNLLEALASRRDQVCLIGCNLLADAPGNFRCDRCYLVPPSLDPAFPAHLEAIIAQEQPDLILPGRDDDVLVLADLGRRRPDLAPRIACGSPESAAIICDKALSAGFAREQGLAYAEFCLAGGPADRERVLALGERQGWPLIAKRPRGFGSQGVCLVPDAETVTRLLPEGPWLFQEYLEPPPELPALLARWRSAPPLFFQIPETRQIAAQTVIGPTGEIAPFCITRLSLIQGRPESSEALNNPTLAARMRQWAEALATAGWRGSLNLQLKQAGPEHWKVFELSGRLTGSSSARLLHGYDELGKLIKAFRPELGFADQSSAEPRGRVLRTFSDLLVPAAEIEQLSQQGIWEAGQP